MTDEVRFNSVHVPAGSATGGQFGTQSGGKKATPAKSAAKSTAPKKATSAAHPASPWRNGVMSYDPHSNHGPGYDSPKGDPTVHQLQQALIRLGVTDDQGRKLADDGKLGPLTTQAVKEAQRRLGVNQDGQVTPTLLKQLVAAQSLPGKPKAPSHPSAPHAPVKPAPKAAAKPAPKPGPAPAEPPQHGLVKYRGDGMDWLDERAQMSTESINDLPDSAFAYIEPGGSKDSEGKTTPRSLRHFPIHDADHVRNALSRAPQSPFGDKAMPAIRAAAKKFGVTIGSDADDSGPARAALHIGMERRIYPAEFEVRASQDGTGGSKYSLTGYATVYGQPYQMVDKHGEYREQVMPGAAQRTLAQNPDVQLLVNHADLPLARTKSGTLRLTEDSRGLHVDADLDPTDPDVQRIQPKMKRGDLSEMSFAFKTTRQEWSDDYTRRNIIEYNLHRGDVSLVTFGANPNTGAAMRAQDFDLLDEESARILYERLSRRFETPPPAAMPLRLAMALAQAQG